MKEDFLDRNEYTITPGKIGCEKCKSFFEFPNDVFFIDGKACKSFYACEDAFNEYAKENGLEKNGKPIKTMEAFNNLKNIFQVVPKGCCREIKERD